MKRGSVCWVNLEPAHPPEFGKLRPAIVVSNSDQNDHLPTVVVVPLSSREPEIWPLRLKSRIGAQEDAYAVIPGIRQVNKIRLRETIGMAPGDFLEKLDEAIFVYLSD
ncbi:MAG: type II toxin-antitoxin system PemK/MazF family toxin [Deltaproteobacteria bacterium]|nr:type II toxin-antitoxin system PemK/MazF family toxin [Deltaproteobacteria bacterium]